MIKNKTFLGVTIAGVLLSTSAWAQLPSGLVLSLDARQPGSSSSTQWEDLSGLNNPFTVVGTPTLTANAAGAVYLFQSTNDERDSFLGDVANEGNFDFETSVAGSADPFTVVMYLNTLWGNQANRNEPILRKHLTQPPGLGGWSTSFVSDFGVRIPVARQWGQGGDNRMQATYFGTPNSGIPDFDPTMHLLVFHLPGDGAQGSTQLYVDGSTTPATITGGPNNLNSSTLNNDPLEIGRGGTSAGDFFGEIQFIEIYSGSTIFNNINGTNETPAQYSATRFANRGSIVVGSPAMDATVFTWLPNSSGDWNGFNWGFTGTGGPTPNSNEHTAIFGDAIGSDTRVVFTDQPITVNRISFENTAGSYVISGSPGVSLDQTSGGTLPTVDVQGTHEFQVPVNLLANTTADVASSSTLVFNNAVDLMGNTLIKSGAGEMAIRNDLITSGGTIQIQGGTVSGSGTIGGSVNNDGGTISPGNSPGVLSIEGDLSQSADSSILIELAGTEHDVLVVDGETTLAGTLEVSLLDGFQPGAGERFDILDFASISGEFDAILLPELTAGLAWDESTLLSEGILSVVPEPAGLILWLLGLLGAFSLSRQSPGTMRRTETT